MKKLSILFFFWAVGLAGNADAAIQETYETIKGVIIDKQTKEPLIGATVQVLGTTQGAVADMDGSYVINLRKGTYTLEFKYVGYKAIVLKALKISHETVLNIEMESDAHLLNDVTVVAQMKRNTEMALMTDQRRSLVVQSGVSAQQITRTQDKDASEVIKRVPGISIIDNKFVMVRGLSQRYNNVWINGSAVPSSEADSRAFSFDLIPSSQLDNMIVVKSPAPEYPADFSGGFIQIHTKDIPTRNSFTIGMSGSINDQTHFTPFLYNPGSSTDFLGFDNGLRTLQGGINAKLQSIADRGVDLQNNGFNNNWMIKRRTPIADMGLNMDFSRHHEFANGSQLALSGAMNYSTAYKSYEDMENSLFGAYDTANDRSNYLRKSTDNQYNHDVRLGAMLNLTFAPKNNISRFEFKNIFNQLGKDRYTNRKGFDSQDNQMESAEYYYRSRTTYNGQFTGKHTYRNSVLDWSTGYAYSNRNLPDRRRYTINDALEEGVMSLSKGNDINREYTELNEHIVSGSLNYKYDFDWGNEIKPTLKTGAYGEYRTRDYTTRQFDYYWNQSQNTLPSDFRHMDIANELLTDKHYGADKLYLLEEVKWRNNYEGNNLLLAGYLGMNLPLGDFNIYTGLRFEHNNMELISNTRDAEKSPKSTFYTYNDLFPSLNMSYKLTEQQQLRLSYGRSVNRPEFREVSSSVFYDFDLGSAVQGNTELRNSYINNIDFRYEYYPSSGEVISAAVFYKQFNDPIEWVYTVTGGTDLVYSFNNAQSAYSLGVEVDIRKDLAFIGLSNFTWSFNGALIKSKVNFEKGSRERDRPMQGQSPYLVNTGLFYQGEALNVGLLYNRIGKRIIGVGRTVGLTGGENTVNIPNSYEMPRNVIDLSASLKLNKHWLIKMGVRDLLAERVYYKQFTEVTHKNGTTENIEEITKSYQPGRNFNLSINYTF